MGLFVMEKAQTHTHKNLATKCNSASRKKFMIPQASAHPDPKTLNPKL